MMIRSGFTWIKRWLVLLGKPSFRIVFFILTCLVLMVAVYIVYWVDPSQKPLTPACSFYHFTGLYCPGCGMTRLHNALHGRFGMAFSYNLCGRIVFLLQYHSDVVLLAHYRKIRLHGHGLLNCHHGWGG